MRFFEIINRKCVRPIVLIAITFVSQADMMGFIHRDGTQKSGLIVPFPSFRLNVNRL